MTAPFFPMRFAKQRCRDCGDLHELADMVAVVLDQKHTEFRCKPCNEQYVSKQMRFGEAS